MSERKKPDRFSVEKKDRDDWNRLKDKDSPFSGSDNKDIFLAAMITGYHEKVKFELKTKDGYFFSDNLKPQEEALVKAIAVSETGSLNVLIDEERVFEIAEQYATGGLSILKNRVFSGEYGSYAKKLETELLREFSNIAQAAAINPPTLDELNAIPAMDLVIGGENDKVEFKSSFLWDYQKKAYSKDVKIAVVRVISAFMNSEGGFLIIGVDDDKNLIGIDLDLAQVQKSFDKWVQTLTNAINTYLGKINGVFVSIRMEKVEDKDIVVLRVKKSPHPVYLKYEDGKEEFFIRSNNTSQQLSISDATLYIEEHWKDVQ
jgi:ribosomal protein S17